MCYSRTPGTHLALPCDVTKTGPRQDTIKSVSEGLAEFTSEELVTELKCEKHHRSTRLSGTKQTRIIRGPKVLIVQALQGKSSRNSK